jgi:hypothetical protein
MPRPVTEPRSWRPSATGDGSSIEAGTKNLLTFSRATTQDHLVAVSLVAKN